MIFVTTENEPAVILFLTEADIQSIREGRTVFVDERATKGTTFTKVVIAHARTNEDALLMIEKIHPGKTGTGLAQHDPRLTELRCDGCSGIMSPEQLCEGFCIVCWRMKALRLRLIISSRGIPISTDALQF